MKNLMNRFAKCESGATAIEYGLIAALIGVTIIGVVTAAGTEIKSVFEEIQTGLAARGTAGAAVVAPA